MSHAESHLFIELDNYPGFYFPGQTVTGRVVRIVAKPEGQIGIQYFNLKLQGLAKFEWHTMVYRAEGIIPYPRQNFTAYPHHNVAVYPHQDYMAHPHYNVSTHSHENEETYFTRTIQLNRRPKDGAWITSLPPGRHDFPFVFVLPVEIPASYNDSNPDASCRIFYEVEATFLTAGFSETEIKTVKNLHVQRPIDLNLFPSAFKSLVIKDEKFLGYCCCQTGPISFKLTFNKTGFLIGENIQFLAEFVNHTYSVIQSAQVWISRTVTFRAADGFLHHEIQEEQLGRTLNLPVTNGKVVKAEIEIPYHEQFNSFGCSFMKSIYELHIEMLIPSHGNLKKTIPIVIGVVPFVIYPGNSIVGQEPIRQSQSQPLPIIEFNEPGTSILVPEEESPH